MYTQINKSWERHKSCNWASGHLHYWASARLCFEIKSVTLHVASEWRFYCPGFFSFPRVMGDVFGFTRSTDGLEINSDVPWTDMGIEHSLWAASSTGAHSDLREVGDQTVLPEHRHGRCWWASSGTTWCCGTRYTPWKTWPDRGRGKRVSVYVPRPCGHARACTQKVTPPDRLF